MGRIKYIFQRLKGMNYKAMFEKISGIHEKTKKPRVFILADMAVCAVKYGAGYMDYDLFEMYKLTPAQRDTYMTRGRNNELVKRYNDHSYAHIFDNKDEFDERFKAYLNRDAASIANKEACLELIRKHDVVFAKPVVGSCGKGVERLLTKDFESAEALYDYVAAYGLPYVLEEEIRQHPAVSAMYPHAINTLRFVTIVKDGEPHIVYTCWRIGNHGKSVDNFNNGGMVTPVDEKTGVVLYPAYDKSKHVFEEHPETGTKIVGFQLPDWDQAVALIKKASLEVPQMAYIGWDLAFSEDGPCLVEGNDFTGHDLYQLPPHTPDGIGVYPKFLV